MALWGITDADESKPKWLTTAQKKEIYANNSGWVVEGGSSQQEMIMLMLNQRFYAVLEI